MQFASFFSGYPDWLDRTLNYLDNMFWQDHQSIDYQSPAFYVYKPYPSSISGKRLESWVKLQERALSPYKNGDCYSISMKKGVAIWFSKTKFSGMPETAHQQAFDDGTWIVKGQRLAYRQVWQDGILLSCDNYPVSSLPEDAETLAALTNVILGLNLVVSMSLLESHFLASVLLALSRLFSPFILSPLI